jgi:hypothetical protein
MVANLPFSEVQPWSMSSCRNSFPKRIIRNFFDDFGECHNLIEDLMSAVASGKMIPRQHYSINRPTGLFIL